MINPKETPMIMRLVNDDKKNYMCVAPITKFEVDYDIKDEEEDGKKYKRPCVFLVHKYLDNFVLVRDAIFEEQYWNDQKEDFKSKTRTFEERVIDELEVLILTSVHESACEGDIKFEDGRHYKFDWRPKVLDWYLVEETEEVEE